MKHLNWLGAWAILVLSGCQIPDYTGSGPLTLSTSHQKHFKKYLSNNTASKYYMITEDHQAAFNFYCEDVTGCQMSPGQAINLCEMRWGKTCKLYADGNDVVWRFGGQSSAANDTRVSRASLIETTPTNSVSLSKLMPDIPLCSLAIKSDHPKWETMNRYRNEVHEAKRRGLTEQQCAQISGKFTERQIAAVHQPPRQSTTAQSALTLNTLSAKTVCIGAIKYERPRWDHNRNSTLVSEAKRRGFTEQQCAQLSVRFTEQQISAAFSTPQSVASPTNNKQLCDRAIQARLPVWEAKTYWRIYANEAKSIGLTEQQCARITGRFSEEQIHKSASVISPPKNDTKADTNSDVEQQLLKVKDLMEKGLITPKEAAQKRKEILGRL